MTSLLETTPAAESPALAPDGDDRLVTWLRLLGWDVQLGRRGHVHVAVARRILDDTAIEVATRGRSRAEAVVKLFEAAVERASLLTHPRAASI